MASSRGGLDDGEACSCGVNPVAYQVLRRSRRPDPNSLVVAASAVVTDDEGRILLHRCRDNDLWALPGGGMELTDSLPGTADDDQVSPRPEPHLPGSRPPPPDPAVPARVFGVRKVLLVLFVP